MKGSYSSGGKSGGKASKPMGNQMPDRNSRSNLVPKNKKSAEPTQAVQTGYNKGEKL